MKTFTYTIRDENGMHARPAGKLATYAKRFSSQIRVKTEDKEADAKRLLALMSLGAVCGSVLEFVITGEDEEEAMQGLKHFCVDVWEAGQVQ